MNETIINRLEEAQQTLEPSFKALGAANAALKRATKLAGEEKLDALAMQKALVKLEQANEGVQDKALRAATDAFADETQKALGALSFEFARDLKDVFEARGETVEGSPPTLVVDELALQIDISARKAQWFYGKEALTRPLPLSINTLLKAYDQQKKAIILRAIDTEGFIADLFQAWQALLGSRSRRPSGGRINIIETYSKLILNRQSARFWNNPSRRTFKDYERSLFVRDLVLTQATPTIILDGQRYRLRLGVATKSQADSVQRSLWLPNGPLDGEYYSDITFGKET